VLSSRARPVLMPDLPETHDQELANKARLRSPLKHPRGLYESRCSTGHD
jgi:hypothetical protein